jgi:predicted dehydrogenase
MKAPISLSRRDFVRASLAVGVMASAPGILGADTKGSGKTIKVGLIGCGGRGQGAATESLQAAKILGLNVKITAVADYFKDRALRAGKRFEVPENACYGGATSYQAMMESDAEIVLMAMAPLFRPLHFEAAVKAGKHVFIEKPVAVDPPGCRRVIAAGEEARRKGLVVIAGTEMRHDFSFRLTHQAVVVEKALGRLFGGRIAFCIPSMFSTKPIQPKTADDLVRTWQSWVALSGDHLVEQHVHNIDIANWFCGGPPVSAVGFGGRAQRVAGDMYDFFSVDYDYGNSVHIHSMCRQVNGCWNWTGHDFVYEKGRTSGNNYPNPQKKPMPEDLPKGPTSAVQEQIDVLYHVSKGIPLNQSRDVAESTATAVMGRMAAYTGQQISWKEIMEDAEINPDNYNLKLKPAAEDFEKGTVEIPQENVIARAGKKP